ncbi:hypothetical protein D3C72_1686860 [compost metagenome]
MDNHIPLGLRDLTEEVQDRRLASAPLPIQTNTRRVPLRRSLDCAIHGLREPQPVQAILFALGPGRVMACLGTGQLRAHR